MRQALIRQFEQSLQSKSPNEIITLLALIGIETILEQDHKMNNEVKQLKNTIQKQLKEPTPEPQATKRRELTPKVTEVSPPPIFRQKNIVQRHHLDDQAMRMALSHPEEPQTTKRTQAAKSIVSEFVSPPKSVQYFLDVSNNRQVMNSTHVVKNEQKVDQKNDLKPEQRNMQRNEQRNEVKTYQQQLRQIQQGLTNEMLVDYQQKIQNTKPPTPEESLQEQQIKQYIQKVKNVNQTPQMYDESTNLPSTKHQKKQSQESQGENQTFSFLHKHKTLQTQPDDKDKKQSLMHLADKLLNSPIIRQVSIRSAEHNTPQTSEEKVQVSKFDSSQVNDSMSSNSSAFSLFQPNEELRSFFRRELVKEEDENLDPNIKYSNIFLKGRMGGSKVF
ncbi:hypothetical protein pb186bvf_006016 [Paramecium bursaria]